MNSVKKVLRFLTGCFVFLMASIFIWDALDLEQKWLHYSKRDEFVEHGRYASLAGCEAAMSEVKMPSGCMRIDGPFRILGVIRNTIFR